MAPQTFESFFDLPTELREQILSYVCLFRTGILVGGGEDGQTIALPSAVTPHGSDSSTSTSGHEFQEEYAGPPLNLFLASPVFYREAGDIYYGRNVFHLELASLSTSAWGRIQQKRSRARMRALMELLAKPETAGARARICSVVVYVRRFGAAILEMAAPALGDMVLNGSLRRLRVDVREGGRGFELPAGEMMRVRSMDHTANPALRALLTVLADPDMEKGELRVMKRLHAWFWCQFHEHLVPQGERGCLMLAHKVGNDDEFLDVDIHRVVEACAGDAAEFRIKRVRVR
ncbi:hypothetical protein VTI74DRAFT_8224 [Chaetomium olivicolor]